jgi:hypothetical protein
VEGTLNYHVLQENFKADLGFLRHTGVRRLEPLFTYSPRPKIPHVRQLMFTTRFERYDRIDTGELETQLIHLVNRINFQDGSYMQFIPHVETEHIFTPFKPAGNLVVPPGKYTWAYWPLLWTLNPAWKFSGNFRIQYDKDYYGKGGRRWRWQINPTIKLSERFSAQMQYEINQIALFGAKDLQAFHQINSRVNYNFNRQWLTSTTIQYTTTGNLIGVNARLNYIYRPGDNIFVVFNNFTTDTTEGSRPVTQLDRSFVVKMTHSFDF